MLLELNKILMNYLGAMYPDVIRTIISIIVLTIIYSFISYFVKKKTKTLSDKRRILVNTRNFLIIAFILIEFFLWSGEIKTLFISATAIFAACLITFKELILSFFSSLFITSNKLFSVGHIIKIGDNKGKVIDKNLFFTKIIVNDGLGKKELVIPNKFFIDNSFENLSHYNGFTTLNLELCCSDLKNLSTLSQSLENKIIEISKQQEENYIKLLHNSIKDDIFSEPIKKFYDIKYVFNNKNPNLLIKVFINEREALTIEQQILDLYFKEVNK